MFSIKKSRFVIWLLVAAVAGAGICFGIVTVLNMGTFGYTKVPTSEYEDMKELSERYGKLDELYQIIEKNYYTDIDEEALMIGAYKGLFAGLGDPYSTYMTAEEYKQWESSVTGEFDGVGIQFTLDDEDNYVIVSVIDDTPAKEAGLEAGDIILSVDGKTYDDVDTMAAAIRGDAGTTVKIKYSRDGKEKTVSIERAHIVNQSVSSKVLEDNIGYIQITTFEENTAEDFEKALKKMEQKKVKGLVIDLRNNGGGLVDEGVQIADTLLGEGTITYMQSRDGKKEYYESDDDATELPYVLLVNEGTASTSEIVTAAIKDYKGGSIVGTKTFGKGIVQSTTPFKEGDAVKLTVLQYFSPKGNQIHEKGVTPDYKVEMPEDQTPDTQLNKALELLK